MKNKKATWFGYLSSLAPAIGLAVFFITSVAMADFKANNVPIGEDQLAIMRADLEAQKALLYLDFTGKMAAEQSVYDTAASGGHDLSPCGDYFGYNSWQDLVSDEGTIKVKDCSEPDIQSAFNNIMNSNIWKLTGPIPSLTRTGYTSTIDEEGKVTSMGHNPINFEVTVERVIEEAFSSDYDGSQINYIPGKGTKNKIKFILEHWEKEIDLAVQKYPSLPKEVLIGFMTVESSGNPNTISFAGAAGLVQLMPHTAYDAQKKATGTRPSTCPYTDPLDQLTDDCNRRPGISWRDYGTSLKEAYKKSPAEIRNKDTRFNPQLNVMMAAAYIDTLVKRYKGDWYKVAVAYNRGSGYVNKHIEKGNWALWEQSGYRCGDPKCSKFGNSKEGLQKDYITVQAQNYGVKVVSNSFLAKNIMTGETIEGDTAVANIETESVEAGTEEKPETG